MKKLTLILAVAICLVLQSCGSAPADQKKDGKTNKTTNTKADYKTKATGKVEYISYDDFVERVSDPNSDSEYWEYRGDKSAIVDFTASWCGPCQQLSPVLDALAQKYKGDIVIYKVDIDQEPELAQMFEVSVVPTLVFFPVGGEAFSNEGGLSRSEFESIIEDELM
ncbi:MAG: thioredoxin domain-containing protein [Rikenellaceae bacterium]